VNTRTSYQACIVKQAWQDVKFSVHAHIQMTQSLSVVCTLRCTLMHRHACIDWEIDLHGMASHLKWPLRCDRHLHYANKTASQCTLSGCKVLHAKGGTTTQHHQLSSTYTCHRPWPPARTTATTQQTPQPGSHKHSYKTLSINTMYFMTRQSQTFL